ncbi:hypothetical protein C8T65DRAFT_645849 [Cerioporus squamosus]|nr:hypothetical protein C8T65DRAFT_645849 [Cerioporus squamosus]
MSGDVSRTIKARRLLPRLGRAHARRLDLCRPSCAIRDAHADSDAPPLGTTSSYASREPPCALHPSRRGHLTHLFSSKDDVGAGHGSRWVPHSTSTRYTLRSADSLSSSRAHISRPQGRGTCVCAATATTSTDALPVSSSSNWVRSPCIAGACCDAACQRARSDAIKGRTCGVRAPRPPLKSATSPLSLQCPATWLRASISSARHLVSEHAESQERK